MQVDTQLLVQFLVLLGTIGGVWVRLEHRLTRVETLLGILNGRR